MPRVPSPTARCPAAPATAAGIRVKYFWCVRGRARPWKLTKPLPQSRCGFVELTKPSPQSRCGSTFAQYQGTDAGNGIWIGIWFATGPQFHPRGPVLKGWQRATITHRRPHPRACRRSLPSFSAPSSCPPSRKGNESLREGSTLRESSTIRIFKSKQNSE